jgi:hypothetical protein
MTLDRDGIHAAFSALLTCPDRLIGIRAAGSHGPAAQLADRSAYSFSLALEEASQIYPNSEAWEVVSAESAIADATPRGHSYRDPAVIARFRT